MQAKYIEIFHKIVRKIEEREYASGSKIPSEKELTEYFVVSRDTIRKALNMLENDGYIHKVKGKGSFVLDRNKIDFPVSGLISFQELAPTLGNSVETIVEEVSYGNPNVFVREHMQMEKESELVCKVVRARKIDGKNIILDIDYYDGSIVTGLNKGICSGSIFSYIEQELQLKIGFAKKEIVVESCSDEDKMYLDLEGYDMVVVVHTYVYLDDGLLLQYGQSRHRPDKFRFIDFARRKV